MTPDDLSWHFLAASGTAVAILLSIVVTILLFDFFAELFNRRK